MKPNTSRMGDARCFLMSISGFGGGRRNEGQNDGGKNKKRCKKIGRAGRGIRRGALRGKEKQRRAEKRTDGARKAV